MASPNILKLNKGHGFTLIEIIIVLGLLSVISGFGLFFGFDFYRNYSLRSEKDTIVNALRTARSRSMHNIHQVRHGVHFEKNPSLAYTIFRCEENNSQCSEYMEHPEDTMLEASFEASLVPPSPAMPFDIIFDQLSGNCSSCKNSETTIRISDQRRYYDVSINQEGQIDG